MDPSSQTAAAAGTIGLVAFAGYAVFVIISLICWIKVLIALFKKEGAGLGILGILCTIYAFIWGWLKSTEQGLKKTMVWWTISILGMIVIGIVASVSMAGAIANDPSFQKAIQDAQEKARQEQQVTPEPAPVPAPAPQ